MARWLKVGLWLHRWTGLIATPFFLVLCLTGSVLIFHEELDRLLGDRPPGGGTVVHPVSFDALAIAAVAGSTEKRVQLVALDPDEPDQALVLVAPMAATKLEDGVPVLISRSTGQRLPFSNPDGTLTGFLLKLHSQWFLKLPGQIFGGVVALLVLVCLLSGVIVYSPFGRRHAFGTVRTARGRRILHLDLHNLFGVVVLGWAAAVTVSGVMLAAGAVLLPLWQSTELKAMAGGYPAAPARLVSADIVVAAAEQAMPDRRLRYVFYPGTEFSSAGHYTAAMFGTRRYNERLFDVVLVDAGTGRVAASRPLPVSIQAILLSEPLHFGDYGGVWLKLFWLANAWSAMFITGNGAWLWWKRRARRSVQAAA